MGRTSWTCFVISRPCWLSWPCLKPHFFPWSTLSRTRSQEERSPQEEKTSSQSTPYHSWPCWLRATIKVRIRRSKTGGSDHDQQIYKCSGQLCSSTCWEKTSISCAISRLKAHKTTYTTTLRKLRHCCVGLYLLVPDLLRVKSIHSSFCFKGHESKNSCNS